MRVDASDALVVCGLLLVGSGLYFLAWPLVLIEAGLLAGYVGVRRS